MCGNGRTETRTSSGAAELRVGTNTAHITVLSNFITLTWKERNQRIFQGQTTNTPIKIILQLSYQDVDAYPAQRSSEEILALMRTSKAKIEEWRCTWERGRNRGVMVPDVGSRRKLGRQRIPRWARPWQ
ncbi:hypothetical protein R1sor_023681 [Riccia sorocarpa]|uniref:Uncharacterized protein n=1 Tax=Riccia sorocarpa TaxID=122646 RepID=A0ABD3GRN2_9MARC